MNGASFRWIDALFSFEAMKVLLEGQGGFDTNSAWMSFTHQRAL